MEIRCFGLGLRSRFDLAPAAFVNTVCQTVPRTLLWQKRNGSVHAGFLPRLEALLGAGSFDWNNEDSRFQHLLRSGCRLGDALESSWEGLRANIGPTPDGVLRHGAAAAGRDSNRLQRDLTWQIERPATSQSSIAGSVPYRPQTCSCKHGQIWILSALFGLHVGPTPNAT